MFTSTGTLCYRETYNGVAIKPGWLICLVDIELASYYMKMLKLPTWALPMRGPHITVVSGEKESTPLRNNTPLLSLDNHEVEFSYDWPMYTNVRAYWFNIHSPQLATIRSNLGLKERLLHMTVGNIK